MVPGGSTVRWHLWLISAGLTGMRKRRMMMMKATLADPGEWEICIAVHVKEYAYFGE